MYREGCEIYFDDSAKREDLFFLLSHSGTVVKLSLFVSFPFADWETIRNDTENN